MWGFVQFSSRTVGSGGEPFVHRLEERARWVLRQIYYKEKNLFAREGRYANNTETLGLPSRSVEGFQWPPVMSVTPNMFEATLRSIDGESISIRQDGRVWK